MKYSDYVHVWKQSENAPMYGLSLSHRHANVLTDEAGS